MNYYVTKRGIDFSKLHDLLSDKNWRAADEETKKLMCKTVRASHWFGLTLENILEFPCEELLAIDRYWTENSAGRFGFSVQLNAFMECNGDIKKFASAIGWRMHGNWIAYSDVDWSERAPTGQLPIGGRGGLVAGIGDVTQGRGLTGYIDTSFSLFMSAVGDLFHEGGWDRFWVRLKEDVSFNNGFSKAWMRPRIFLLERFHNCVMQCNSDNKKILGKGV